MRKAPGKSAKLFSENSAPARQTLNPHAFVPAFQSLLLLSIAPKRPATLFADLPA